MQTRRGRAWIGLWLALVALSAPARAELTLVEDEYDLVHLTGARGAVASPDGQHLYVRVPTASAIAIYARSAATGALTHLDSVVDGANGVMGLAGVADLAMSPNGASLYAFGPQGIAVFARSAATGQLTFVELESDGPSTLFANVTGGAVRANGANVYASSYDDSSVASFSRAGDGSLTYLGAVARVQTPQFGLIGADCVVVTPDSLDAYVCGALDRAVVYLRASLAGDGNLTATGYVPEYFVPGGAQVPLHGVTEGDVSSDGLFVYFAVDFARSIVAFTREPATSFLFHLQTVADGATPGGSRGPQSVRLHPSGRRLYASVLDAPSAENGALTAFTREADGTLSFLEALEGASTPGRAWTDPGELAISPDGAHLYAPDPSGFVKVLATNVVPEPGGLAAACVALAVLALRRRRSR